MSVVRRIGVRDTARCYRLASTGHGWTDARMDHHPGRRARNERQWQVDVTFLASSWHCIFGQGCQGVLTEPAPEMVQGCCSYGAYESEKKVKEKVEKLAKRLGDDEWQFKEIGLKKGVWASAGKDEWRTRLHEDACVFLNRPGFEAGPGLRAAPARDEHRQALQRHQAHRVLAVAVAGRRPRRGRRVGHVGAHRVRPRRLGRGRRRVRVVVHRGARSVHRRRSPSTSRWKPSCARCSATRCTKRS